MKTITIPETQTVIGINQKGDAIPVLYGLCRFESSDGEILGFLEQLVWPDEFWRDGKIDTLKSVLRLIPAFNGKRPGEEVAISDNDHEYLVKCAMLKGKSLEPALAYPVLMILMAIVDAKDTKEEN